MNVVCKSKRKTSSIFPIRIYIIYLIYMSRYNFIYYNSDNNNNNNSHLWYDTLSIILHKEIRLTFKYGKLVVEDLCGGREVEDHWWWDESGRHLNLKNLRCIVILVRPKKKHNWNKIYRITGDLSRCKRDNCFNRRKIKHIIRWHIDMVYKRKTFVKVNKK